MVNQEDTDVMGQKDQTGKKDRRVHWDKRGKEVGLVVLTFISM